MTKRLLTSSSMASLSPSICEAARSPARTIWFWRRSMTALAAGVERKLKDWVATNGYLAFRSSSQRPGRVVAGYSLTPNMPANRCSPGSRISRLSRPMITRLE